MKAKSSIVRPEIRVARAYEVSDRDRGYRVLVDRIWPRGVTKESLAVDEWPKELAPTTELRRWFNHLPQKWEEFQKRYGRDLATQADAIAALLARANRRPLLLIYGARDTAHNNAIALRAYLLKHTR